jgi:hypothetical protein
MDEIKRKKRLHISADVFINRTVKAEGLDLSEDGMYLYTSKQYVAGSIVEVSLKLDNDEVDVQAKVVHSQPGIGLGVQFVDIKGETNKKIKNFLDKYGSPAPEKK